MSLLTLALLFLVWGGNLAHDYNLLLNDQSPFAQEVEFIKHNVHTREISIALKNSRKCVAPTLRVRLSGASLYILDVLKVETNVFTYGYPKLIDTGEYFIEVLVLMCRTLDPNAYAGVCLEDVTGGKNIVTLPYSFRVRSSNVLHNGVLSEQRPRWVLPDKNQPTLLPTRYQLTNCTEKANSWCPSKPVDVYQHNLY